MLDQDSKIKKLSKRRLFNFTTMLCRGWIIETVCNKNYEQVLDSLLLKPLRLSHTGYKDHYTIIHAILLQRSCIAERGSHAEFVNLKESIYRLLICKR